LFGLAPQDLPMNKLTNIIIKASLVIVAFLGIFLFSTKFNQIYGNYECNNGPNNRDSNGCGRPCYNGEPWSKYEVNNSCGSLPFGWAWWGTNICAQRIGYICSTGDKCVSGEKGLRPGYCDCGSSGPLYKTCCSGSTPVNCNNYYQQDNYPPPEGTCAPNTMVDGGSCPCNCSTWTLGSCGASGCSSTQKPKIRTCDNDCATEFDGCQNDSSCCS